MQKSFVPSSDPSSSSNTATLLHRTMLAGGILLVLSGCAESSTDGISGAMILDESDYASRTLIEPAMTTASCVTVSAESECGLSSVDGVVVSGEHVYTLSDGQLMRLLADSAAVILARGGGGPGELRAPIAIGTGSDSGVSVFDIGRMRLIAFQHNTSPTEAVVFPPSGFRAALVRSGRLFAYALPPAASIGDTVEGAVLGFKAADTTWADTLARFSEPAVSVRGEGGQALSRLPWDPRVLWDVCDDGEVVVGNSNAWLVTWYRDGTATGSVRRQAAPARMSDAEHDSLSDDWLERSPKLASFRELLATRLAVKPSARPQLSAIYCGSGNSVVLVNTPAFGDEKQRVDVIGRDGSLQFSGQVPVRLQVIGVNQDELLAVEQHELGEAVYRLPLGAK